MISFRLPLQYQYGPPVFHRGAQATLLRPSDPQPPPGRGGGRAHRLDGLRAAGRRPRRGGGAAEGGALRGHAAARRRPREAGQPPLAPAED